MGVLPNCTVTLSIPDKPGISPAISPAISPGVPPVVPPGVSLRLEFPPQMLFYKVRILPSSNAELPVFIVSRVY